MRVFELDDIEEFLETTNDAVNHERIHPRNCIYELIYHSAWYLAHEVINNEITTMVMRSSLLAVRTEDAAGDLAEELFEHGGDGVHRERVDVDEAALGKVRYFEMIG